MRHRPPCIRPQRNSIAVFVSKGWLSLALLAALFAIAPAPGGAQEQALRVPGETWMAYEDVRDAGFDPEALEAARVSWEAIPSSAFLVVANGAVVAAWGDIERRFMAHSVRKSFLSGLYGIYWDRGEIELNKTLADLELDDEPDPLLAGEKQARILDLLKARSGIFHPAAYAGRTDSRPRGSEGPGRYFAYNNWDFNTAAAILRQETGADVFEAFDEFFAQPLGMQDWRVSDGYYHYERDKSQYPAYPFRISARDMARFGLLYARDGLWGDRRILSRDWVKRSSALYSIDNDQMGYGLYWWIFREPRFARHGMYAALGVGNQMIAVLPESDLVIVNRANTYEGEGTPPPALSNLIEQVLAARTGVPAAEPALHPLVPAPEDPRHTAVEADRLAEFVGAWTAPEWFGLPPDSATRLAAVDGHLTATHPRSGTLSVYLQDDGSLFVEDLEQTLYVFRDPAGAISGIALANDIEDAALLAAADGRDADARMLLDRLPGSGPELTTAVVSLLGADPASGEAAIRSLNEAAGDRRIGGQTSQVGRYLLDQERPESALILFRLNADIHGAVWQPWFDLAGAQEALGDIAAAIASLERARELGPDVTPVQEALDRLRDREP